MNLPYMLLVAGALAVIVGLVFWKRTKVSRSGSGTQHNLRDDTTEPPELRGNAQARNRAPR